MSKLSNIVSFCEQYKKAALHVMNTQSSESNGISKDSGIEYFTNCHLTLIMHK